MADWQCERRARDERLAAGSKFAAGKMVAPNDATALLEAVVRPKDRICLEGDNQKQADFLAGCRAKADPKVLHVVQSGIVLPDAVVMKGAPCLPDIAANRARRARRAVEPPKSLCGAIVAARKCKLELISASFPKNSL